MLQSPAWLHDCEPGLGPGAARFTSSRGRLHRQRPQQHLVEDREDCGVGADAERQREDRDGGDEPGAEQCAERELQIDHHLCTNLTEAMRLKFIVLPGTCTRTNRRARSIHEANSHQAMSSIVAMP